jgi:hypothetical protein
MKAQINDNRLIFVTDETPDAEARYRARFYFHPNSLTMNKNSELRIFSAQDASGTAVVQIGLRLSGANYQVRVGVLDDAGALVYTDWSTILSAPQAIEIDWQAATGGGQQRWGDAVGRRRAAGEPFHG